MIWAGPRGRCFWKKGTKTSRSALFIAYHYPPARSAGAARTTAFLRYLPACGYRCQVLTTSAFGGEDDVLRAWEPLSLYRWLFNRQVRSGEGHSAVRTRRGLLSRIGRALFIPDLQVSWLPAAFSRGLRYLRSNDCDVIYTSFPPASAHLLGYLLQRVTGLPWVADFRDAWIFDPLDVYLEEDSLRKRIEERIEGRVVASASAVVVASQEVADYLCTRYAAHADRVRVISNGFDGEWPDRSRPPQSARPCTCYTRVRFPTVIHGVRPRSCLMHWDVCYRKTHGGISGSRSCWLGCSAKGKRRGQIHWSAVESCRLKALLSETEH